MSIQQLKKRKEQKERELCLIEDQISSAKTRQTIPCAACGYRNMIGRTPIIQTYWYTPPHGCTGGDYWNRGELNFHCGRCNILNRILFNDYDLPYEYRKKHDFNSDNLFNSSYKSCFLEEIQEHGEQSERFVNNYYVDRNRKRFGLYDKKKAIEEIKNASR